MRTPRTLLIGLIAAVLCLNPVLGAVAMTVPEASTMPATADHCHSDISKQLPQSHSCCKHGLCICSVGVAAPVALIEYSPVRAAAAPEILAPSPFEAAAVPRLLRPPIL